MQVRLSPPAREYDPTTTLIACAILQRIFRSPLWARSGRDPRSAQLLLDLRQKLPFDLANVIATIGDQYIKAQGYRAVVTPNVIWSVHSYAGDYNPLHDHGGKTPLGLSSIFYLKVPPVIAAKEAVAHGGAPKLTMASGNCDGFTQFVWGATGMRDFSLLRPPTQQYMKPEVGKLIGLSQLALAQRSNLSLAREKGERSHATWMSRSMNQIGIEH